MLSEKCMLNWFLAFLIYILFAINKISAIEVYKNYKWDY